MTTTAIAKKSWKTTAGGIAAILGAISTVIIAFANGTLDATILATAGTAIVAAVGLIFARDDDKSSEEVGAK